MTKLSAEAREESYRRRRRFDWDAALALLDEGYTVSAVARHFGVTSGAVYRITLPEEERKLFKAAAIYEVQHDLCECGRAKLVWSAHCARCVRFHQTGARLTDPDESGLVWLELWCGGCGKWLPNTAFCRSKNNPGRGSRRERCRSCDTAERRAYRERTKVACEICGGKRLADREKLPHLRRGRKRERKLWPFCGECLRRSRDPRAVAARQAMAAASHEVMA